MTLDRRIRNTAAVLVLACGAAAARPAEPLVVSTGWLKALETLDALDANVIVPGHGEPLRDETLLHATQQVFRELLRQGRDAHARGVDVDAAAAAILPTLDAPRRTITRDESALNEAFRVQLVDWFLHRVYEEQADPLDDTIAKIPER